MMGMTTEEAYDKALEILVGLYNTFQSEAEAEHLAQAIEAVQKAKRVAE